MQTVYDRATKTLPLSHILTIIVSIGLLDICMLQIVALSAIGYPFTNVTIQNAISIAAICGDFPNAIVQIIMLPTLINAMLMDMLLRVLTATLLSVTVLSPIITLDIAKHNDIQLAPWRE